MKFLWLSAVGVGLIGVMLYLVAKYDYSHFDWRSSPSGTGLRDWVRFYQEHRLLPLVAPIAAISFGIGGFLATLVSGKSRRQRVGQASLNRGPHIPLRIPPVVRRNSIATVAITLSIINFGLVMWQVWPEGTYTPPKPSPQFSYSAPSPEDIRRQRRGTVPSRPLPPVRRVPAAVPSLSPPVNPSLPSLEEDIQRRLDALVPAGR